MEIVVLLIVVVLLGYLALSVLGLALHLLWYLLIGALVGTIANWAVSYFQPAGGPQGFLSTALAGIAGSFLAAILFGRQGLIASVIGAMIVVFLWKLASGRRYAH